MSESGVTTCRRTGPGDPAALRHIAEVGASKDGLDPKADYIQKLAERAKLAKSACQKRRRVGLMHFHTIFTLDHVLIYSVGQDVTGS